MKEASRSTAVWALSLGLWAWGSDAVAAPLFGALYSASAYACAAGADVCPLDSTTSNGGLVQATSSGDRTAAYSEVRGAVGGLGDLHLLADVSVFSSEGPINTNALGVGDAFFYDTFSFEAGTYRIDLTFDGMRILSPPANPDWVTVTGDLSQFQLVQDCVSIEPGRYCPTVLAALSIGQTGSYFLTFTEPTTTTLGGLLQVRAGLKINNAEDVAAALSIDASNTAFFDIVGLTPGSSFATASGVSYAPDRFHREVPAPSLLVSSLMALAGFSHWRRRAG